ALEHLAVVEESSLAVRAVTEGRVTGSAAAAQSHSRVTEQEVPLGVEDFDLAMHQQGSVGLRGDRVGCGWLLRPPAIEALVVQGPRGAALHDLGDLVCL